MLTVGSLFSGIGGLDLGLERAGIRVVWQCEADPYCRAVLAKHWPDVPCYSDVRELGRFDTFNPGRVDVLCGGFPCQPVSVVGRRRGAADERWLWPEFARLIRVLRPRYALMENVPGLLAGGGMAEVLGDLAGCGYDAEWSCIPAAAFGAPHLRYRVFIVAYPMADTNRQPLVWSAKPWRQRNPWAVEPDVGRVADGVPSRVDRLRALGNAVVPQVAEWVGRRIIEAEGEAA